MFAVVSNEHGAHHTVSQDAVATARPDILDRNGEILATDIKSPSLYAEPRKIIDVEEAVELLTATLPDLDAKELRERLSSKRGFVWLKREISPAQRREIYRLGIPGIGFLTENKRIYPNGATVSQPIGLVNIDNQGIAGIEKWLDGQGLAALHMAGLATDRLQRPVSLSLDLRVQWALHDELAKARAHFKAKAAAGVILNVNTGEVVALVSEPDYNPNNPREANDPSRINRMTTGVYEMGSTFKVLTVAMGLDSGKLTLSSTYDARLPLQFGRFAIHDYEPKHRFLSVPEIFTFSSNIGAAPHGAVARRRLPPGVPEEDGPARPAAHRTAGKRRAAGAETLGRDQHRHHRLRPWPVGGAAAGGDGCRRHPEWRAADHADLPQAHARRGAWSIAKRVLKPSTSVKMRYLMRLNAEKGTGTFANVKGYYVGGKTGTAEKVINGRYAKHRLMTDFMAVLPADQPRYLLLIMLDEPKAVEGTHGFATAGWNAGPTAGKVMARVAPLLDIEPRFDLPDADHLILAKAVSSR